ncbi:HEAT repeat domain-containing protein [Vitiosangium sp. GDMCC 1.1324]|uniref:HEAT repeat domain-containing protein n=1 Tax=Vitiosangium sp. (strain GDMCC 1.1324) TaxID=2138576 RepID=UPI000D3B4526|nr:HEAT repeat domain-containing protein [Vitiosangium sp. GDMCC 1.1324]PTL83944.1 hypothetical protein DAT35_10820 [Vitiosangium sp. GDMCC 1.1324]
MLKGTRLRIAAALAAITAALALGFFLVPSTPPTSDSSSQAAAPRPFSWRPDWPAGTRYVYTLDWRSQQRAVPPLPGQGAPMEGSLHLSGDLVLRALGHDGEAILLGASLENLRQHELRVAGQEVLPDEAAVAAAYSGREALLEMTPAGTVRAIRFLPEDPDVFKHTVQWLITHMQPTLPADATQRDAGQWDVTENTSLGQARASYEVDANQPRTLRRTRSNYTRLDVAAAQGGVAPQKLDSHATFTFAEAGHLVSLSHQEILTARTDTGQPLLDSMELVRLSLRELGRFSPPADVGLAARTEVRKPGVITTSAAVERRLLEQRAEGLTMEKLTAELLAYGNGGEMPDHSHWLWRATGRLALEPERCRELVAVFENPSFTAQGRALVLDLLVGAGHAQAQAVLRELLETREARADSGAYELFLQRLGLVQAPEKDTLAWLARSHQEAESSQQPHLRNASAYALGAAVGRLGAEDAEAGTYNRILIEGLGAARTPGDRETYLRALGNAGRTENVATVLSYAGDPDASVRAAVAAALRKADTPESTAALLELAGASEPSVQAEALTSLRGHVLNADAMARLRDVVLTQGLSRGTEPLLVALLGERLDAGPAVFQMLQALSLKPSDDPSLRAYVLQLMARAARLHGAP